MNDIINRRTILKGAAAAGAAGLIAKPALGQAQLADAADHHDLPLGRGRRHRRDGAHRRPAPGEGSRPAGQRRQPHRRLRRGRPFGDRDRRAGRLHDRHADGRDLDDAPSGPDRADAGELSAAGADERGPAGRAGLDVEPLQGHQGAGRGDQGGASRQAQGVGHRTGRHLAPGAGRLARGHGPEAEPCRLGAVQRRRARHAGSGRRRHRHRHLLGAGSARHDRCRQGEVARHHGDGTQSAVQGRADAERDARHQLLGRRLARHRRPQGPAGRDAGEDSPPR